MFERLARTAGSGRRAAADAPPRPPLDAFENYIKGLIAESPATQATFLETAIKQYPGYDRAELALWDVRTDQGDHAAALAAARAVCRPRRRWRAGPGSSPAVSLLDLKRYDEAFDVFKALADAARDPTLGRRVERGRAQQPRRRPDPPRRDAADGHARPIS